jgi:thioredoxin-like negative regulator of GroEL
MLAPTLEKIAQDYKDKVVVLKVNVDEPVNQPLAMQFQVQSIPTIAFIQKDKPIEVTVGALPYEAFKEIIDKKLNQ